MGWCLGLPVCGAWTGTTGVLDGPARRTAHAQSLPGWRTSALCPGGVEPRAVQGGDGYKGDRGL